MKIGEKLLNRKIGFTAGLIYFCLPIVNYYEVRVLTEVYTSFLLTLHFYLIIFHKDPLNRRVFLLSGLTLCIVFTFRPVSLLIIPFSLIMLWLKSERKPFFFSSIFYYFLPLILFEVVWIPFNYKRYGEIIPVAKSTLYESYSHNFYTHAQYLCASIGCETKEDWLSDLNVGPYQFQIYPFNPGQIGPFHSLQDAYTDKFNAQTIEQLRLDLKDCAYCNHSNFPDSLSPEQITLEIQKRNILISKVQEMKASVKGEHPFIFLESRLKPLLLFFSHDLRGTPLLWSNDYFDNRSGFDEVMKHLYNIGFSMLILLGIPGLFFILLKINILYKPFILAGLSLTFVYPLIFGMPEWRYIYSAIPFLALGISYVFHLLISLLFRRRYI